MSDVLELEQFTGTEQYYRHCAGLVYTDGVKYLAEKAKCYWLLDIVASYQPQLKDAGFQFWRIEVSADHSAVVTCREDSDCPEIVKQTIEYADFPLKSFEWYVENGVMLLKSEY
jgi:hypothetical protein